MGNSNSISVPHFKDVPNKLTLKRDELIRTMTGTSNAPRMRKKFRHFRILVIGRANAGKTTLLKRVCNTTDEPCIYDEDNKNLVRLLSNLKVPRLLIACDSNS